MTTLPRRCPGLCLTSDNSEENSYSFQIPVLPDCSYNIIVEIEKRRKEIKRERRKEIKRERETKHVRQSPAPKMEKTSSSNLLEGSKTSTPLNMHFS